MLSSKFDVKPLIINGMYRSGTSLLWRVLSGDPLYENCYYEPLHPELPTEVETLEVYKIYKKHPEILHKWSSSFHMDRFYLPKDQDYSELREYLSELILKGSLVKFNRTTLRLGWLLDRFPSAFVINVIRDPRAVCFSYAKIGGFANQGLLKKVFRKAYSKLCRKNAASIFLNSQDLNFNTFWSSDYFKLLESVEPWSDYVKSLANKPPYIKILGLWRVNVVQSLNDLDEFGKGRSVTILHEKFCLSSEQILKNIYMNLGRQVPEEVLREVKGHSVQNLGAIPGHKFHLDISDKFLDQWKQVDNKIWERGLRQAAIIPLMQHLGYY